MNYNRKEVGIRLRKRRRELKLSGAELAKMIGKTGPYYMGIERGDCGMSLETLIQLAAYLGVSLDYLIYGVENKDGEALPDDEMIMRLLGRCEEGKRRVAVEMLKVYMQGAEI